MVDNSPERDELIRQHPATAADVIVGSLIRWHGEESKLSGDYTSTLLGVRAADWEAIQSAFPNLLPTEATSLPIPDIPNFMRLSATRVETGSRRTNFLALTLYYMDIPPIPYQLLLTLDFRTPIIGRFIEEGTPVLDAPSRAEMLDNAKTVPLSNESASKFLSLFQQLRGEHQEEIQIAEAEDPTVRLLMQMYHAARKKLRQLRSVKA